MGIIVAGIKLHNIQVILLDNLEIEKYYFKFSLKILNALWDTNIFIDNMCYFLEKNIWVWVHVQF